MLNRTDLAEKKMFVVGISTSFIEASVFDTIQPQTTRLDYIKHSYSSRHGFTRSL